MRVSYFCLFFFCSLHASLATWWEEDGLVTHSQRQALDEAEGDPGRWCELSRLWVGSEAAQEAGCAEEKRKGKASLGWQAKLDSAGSPDKQKVDLELREGIIRGEASWREDSAWKAPPERWRILAREKGWELEAGDLQGSGNWMKKQKGGRGEWRYAHWRGGLLVASPSQGAAHLGYGAGSEKKLDFWAWKAQETPLVVALVQGENAQGGWHGEPGGPFWSFLRWKLPCGNLPLRIGGETLWRHGDSLPALLELPAALAGVRWWNGQEQGLHIGEWEASLQETWSLGVQKDSVALGGALRRSRERADLSLRGICRDARSGCRAPRLQAGAGFSPWPGGRDSLYSEALWQAPEVQELHAQPRLRAGWAHRLGGKGTLTQSLTHSPEGKSEWRQESRLRQVLPGGGELSLMLRATLSRNKGGVWRPGATAVQAQARF